MTERFQLIPNEYAKTRIEQLIKSVNQLAKEIDALSQEENPNPAKIESLKLQLEVVGMQIRLVELGTRGY